MLLLNYLHAYHAQKYTECTKDISGMPVWNSSICKQPLMTMLRKWAYRSILISKIRPTFLSAKILGAAWSYLDTNLPELFIVLPIANMSLGFLSLRCLLDSVFYLGSTLIIILLTKWCCPTRSFHTLNAFMQMCLKQVDLAKPIPLHVNPQPISSKLKTRLGHGHQAVDYIGSILPFQRFQISCT